jgi:hypothetical protein
MRRIAPLIFLLGLGACADGPAIVASPSVRVGDSGGFIGYRPPPGLFTLGGRERSTIRNSAGGPPDEIVCQRASATCYRNGVPDPALSSERFGR